MVEVVLHLSVLRGQDGSSTEVVGVVRCGQDAVEEASEPQRSWAAEVAGRRREEVYLVLVEAEEPVLDSVAEADRRLHDCL